METGGLVTYFQLKDGSYIKKGNKVIQLDDRELTYDLALLQSEYAQAKLDRDERIMMLGGEFGKDSTISAEQLGYVNIKSGIRTIEDRIKKLQLQQSKMTLYAPYSGHIADVKVRQHQVISPSEETFTIIDPASYEVQFEVLETALEDISIGQSITFSPLSYPSDNYRATISRINPIIDENGLIAVYAKIHGSKKKLYDGMNITIELLSEPEPMIIVPKEAVVPRSERSVVFSYDEAEERSKWKYVTVAHENDTHVAISEGLDQEDIIIIDGNLNLDHDAKVKVVEQISKN